MLEKRSKVMAAKCASLGRGNGGIDSLIRNG
jgi:hypothetical protein